MDEEIYNLEKAQGHFARYRRYERKPQQASDLISRLISRRGFTQEQFNDELQQAWQIAAGEKFAKKTQATIIKRGTLEVLVDSSPAMQQLAFCKTKLLKQIQNQLPEANIKALRFKVGKINT